MTSPPLYSRKANGKLLLTGEYFVLDGALALACPTIYGQTMTVEHSLSFSWQSKEKDGSVWLSIDENDMLPAPNSEKKLTDNQTKLKDILNCIDDFEYKNQYRIQADFPRNWGLGSSSTFIALLADYLQINAYELNEAIFKGSGYDIACAFEDSPILYSNKNDRTKPLISAVHISEDIRPFCYFVYLNQKQDSRDGIHHYRTLNIEKEPTIKLLSDLSEELLTKKYYKDWIYLLTEHENIISSTLKIPRLSRTELKNCPYFSKSLGAWGGDFVMIVTDESPEKIHRTMKRIGFDILMRYEEIVK